jgi:PAS domain S-box-containing protein
VTGYSPDDFLQARVSLASRHACRGPAAGQGSFLGGSGGSPSGSVTIRFRHADQRIRCLRASYRKLARPSGLVLELALADVCRLKTGIGEQALTDDFLAILENSEDCLYFKDRLQVFTAASQRLAVGAGTLEHWTQLIGKTDYEIFPEVYADRRYRQERKILAGGPPLHEIREIPADSGRRCRWVESRKYPIRGPGGEIVGVAGIDRDITDLREATAAQALYQGRYERMVDNLSPAYHVLCQRSAGDIHLCQRVGHGHARLGARGVSDSLPRTGDRSPDQPGRSTAATPLLSPAGGHPRS